MSSIATEIHIPETTPTGRFLNNDPTMPIHSMGNKTLCGQLVLAVRVTGTPTCTNCIALKNESR
jgi:hypothetical protein